jgi:hypothetical protein
MRTKKSSEKKSDLARLATMRDELQVQLHLLDTELKQKWERVNRDWHLIQAEIKSLAPDARVAARRSIRVTRPLISRIEKSLQRIREGLERNHGSA